VRLSRRGLFLAVIALVVVVLGLVARDWYYTRYVWPREIQQEVLGKLLAPSRSLVAYEGYSHYGQGMFRWRYKMDPASKELAALCAEQTIDKCVFSRSRVISEDVREVVSYEGGILTVEEDWS
jgi:hypothetical protein